MAHILTKDALEARRVWGNGNALCSFDCPFIKSVDSKSCFCLLFMCKLRYVDTGNNELCYRCQECKEA